MKKIIFLFPVLVVALYTQQGNVFLLKDYYIQQDFFSQADQVCTVRKGLSYCIPAAEIKRLEKNSSAVEIRDIDRGVKIGGIS